MRLAIVYNPLDNKVREETYSYVYRGMLNALIEKFKPLEITKDGVAADIEADAILFWDVNSCHHITLKGIEKHKSLKIEYMSDPWQEEMVGVYKTWNMPVHKLGRAQRIYRALERGVSHIICPVRDAFFSYHAPHLSADKAREMLWWFPPAPWFEAGTKPLIERKPQILLNGAISNNGIGYDSRYWASQRPQITTVKHHSVDSSVPSGKAYGGFLGEWAGFLALCDTYPVVKFFEAPQAGCVTFMSHYPELEELGFRDMESCIFVDKENFDERTNAFLKDIPAYQKIADAGREVMKNYTAAKFADFLERKIAEALTVKKPKTWTERFNEFRETYESLPYRSHVAFYNEIARAFPNQNRFNKEKVLAATATAKRVLEIGGWKGDLAKEVLPMRPDIERWTNIEISEEALRNKACEDPRYDVLILNDFAWNRGEVMSGYDTLIFSHVVEHMKAGEFRKLMASRNGARTVFIDAPVPKEKPDWKNYGGTHVIDAGWDELDGIMCENGFKTADEGTARIYET